MVSWMLSSMLPWMASGGRDWKVSCIVSSGKDVLVESSLCECHACIKKKIAWYFWNCEGWTPNLLMNIS